MTKLLEETLNLGFLTIDIGTVIFVLINTFLLLFGLKKLLFDKVNEVLEKRKQAISAEYENAAKSKEEAERAKTQYNELLSQSKSQADELIRAANVKAAKRSEEIIAQAKTEAEGITAKARAEIELETKKAKASMKDEIADLAVQVATKIVGREVKKDTHDQLITEFINTVGEF